MTARGIVVEIRPLVIDEVHERVATAERAAGSGDLARASAVYIDAARAASAAELWRIAIRCYRAALEIDLIDREVVARLLRLGARAGDGWSDYARALDRGEWPHFGCRGANIVLGDGPATVRCPEVGPLLELAMHDGDLIDVRPHARFAGMPKVMALIVLRRALWPDWRTPWLEHRHRPPGQVRVVFDAHPVVWLDELGDWRRCNDPSVAV